MTDNTNATADDSGLTTFSAADWHKRWTEAGAEVHIVQNNEIGFTYQPKGDEEFFIAMINELEASDGVLAVREYLCDRHATMTKAEQDFDYWLIRYREASAHFDRFAYNNPRPKDEDGITNDSNHREIIGGLLYDHRNVEASRLVLTPAPSVAAVRIKQTVMEHCGLGQSDEAGEFAEQLAKDAVALGGAS